MKYSLHGPQSRKCRLLLTLSSLSFVDTSPSAPGDTGRNFAAGMSGGVAYVLDPAKAFPDRCNKGLVELETVTKEEEAAELRAYIEEHVEMTGSTVGEKILAEWPAALPHFVKVGGWGLPGREE